jgi:hypothetical protein
LAIAGLLAISLTAAGCASYSTRIAAARESYFQGEFGQAETNLVEKSNVGRRATTCVGMERGSVAFANGDPLAAERLWRAARDELDEMRGTSATESIAAMLADDRQRSYQAPGYEQVMVRVMLSLCSLLRDGIDAESYMLQAELRQRELAESAAAEQQGDDEQPLPPAKPVAFASYVRGMLREASYLNLDEARRAYEEVLATAGECPLASADLERLDQRPHSPPGHGVLYVIGLMGRGPVRQEEIAEPTTTALLITDRIISVLGPYSLPPTIAPVKIPGITLPPFVETRLQISQRGTPLATTETLTDVGLLAQETLAAERNHLIAQAIARRIVKKGVVVASKDALGLRDPATQLAVDVLGVAWEATEAADTRCWSLLPRQLQVARLELPAGRQTLDLSVVGHPDGRSRGRKVQCTIEDGYNTYLVVVAPEEHVLTALASGQVGASLVAVADEPEAVRLSDQVTAP